MTISGVSSSKELDEQLERLRDIQDKSKELLDKKGEFFKVEKLLSDTTAQLKAAQEKEQDNTKALSSLHKEVTVLESEVTRLTKNSGTPAKTSKFGCTSVAVKRR